MLTKARIKQIKSLGDKKFRDSLGLFTAEGEKLVEEALASGFTVQEVYRRDEIGAEAMSRISQLSSPSPVLAVIEKPASTQPPKPVEGRIYLALDGVRDPGNLGTLLRLADWFGAEAVLLSRSCADIFNPKVVQASMGSIFRVPSFYCDLPAFCRDAAGSGIMVYGTFLGGTVIYDAPLGGGGIIVMGSESDGVSPEVEAEVSCRLFIPPHREGPTAESLNVAAAAAITLSEFCRR